MREAEPARSGPRSAVERGPSSLTLPAIVQVKQHEVAPSETLNTEVEMGGNLKPVTNQATK